MFILLSKILPLLFYPIGLCFILLVVSILMKKNPGIKNALLYLVLCILFISSNRYSAYFLARTLEWRYIPQDEIPTAQAMIVLGGATESSSYPRPGVEINNAGDRILFAFRLFKQGKAQHILLSGGTIDWLETGASPAQDMADILLELGIPAQNLWLESTSRNTYENALECKKILSEKKINRIILVTSASHMPRAVAAFEKQGLDVIPAPADFTITQANWEQLTHPGLATLIMNLLPGVDNASLLTKTLKEYLGILVYTMRGWI